VHSVVWELRDFRLNLYFVLHFVLLFCVLTVLLQWAALQLWRLSVVYTVKKISASEMEVFYSCNHSYGICI
jgi:hypothetical protein